MAGDNDHHLPRRDKPLPNVGLEKAMAAAEAVNGVAIVPDFGSTERQQAPTGAKAPTDWDDFARIYGRKSLRRHADNELGRRGLETPATTKEKVEIAVSQAQREAAREVAERTRNVTRLSEHERGPSLGMSR